VIRVFSILVGLAIGRLFAQQSGSVEGSVKDQSGGVLRGAVIALTDSGGHATTAQTRTDGGYTFRGVTPGTYSVSATYPGLAQAGAALVSVTGGQVSAANIVMNVESQKQELNVTESAANQVNTEPANNASALVLRQEDLDALPDDPDDLQADLQALAGPSAGPGGSQIFVDGFTGGRLPPKESIREIRINSNPFSAEYDKLGYGRIEIFTKPGSDKFHGQGYYGTSDGIWNSRNPFLSDNPPFQTQLFGGNVSGPLGSKASFFLDVDRRAIDDNGIINAQVLNPLTLAPALEQSHYPTPQRRTTVSPRVDYRLGANHTLSLRYSYLDNDRLSGIGAFNLPGSGYQQNSTEQLVQLAETSVVSPSVINETHFQYARDKIAETSQSTLPQLNVANSFISGGSGYSASGFQAAYDTQNQYELQNYTSLTHGTHTLKFGVRVRANSIADYSPKNFNGSYTFQGATGVSSLDQYRMALLLLGENYTSAQVAAMGYGPSKYTVTVGNPYIGLSQVDFGPFLQDDWRAPPNLTVSFGLRWEGQTNISDKNDWAPRFGIAWSPGGGSSGTRKRFVIRAGWGLFYDRFAAANVLTADRYNGVNQVNYSLYNPTIFDSSFSTALPLSALTLENTQQKYVIDSHLRAPALMETVVGVERQLFSRTTLSVNFVNSRGTHLLRTVDINAPLPGTYPLGTVGGATNNLGVRPYGDVGDIYLYESTGIFKQTQLNVSVNSSVGKWGTLFSRYAYGTAHSDTDGLGTLPANQYDFSQEYGRSALDVRNTLFVGGSFAAPWKVRVSPFFVAHSGIPFNITTGTDLYLAGQVASTARPGIASAAGAGIIATPYGLLDPIPAAGQSLIERNAGNGPGFLELNLRVSRTWGFGPTKFQGPSGGATSRQGGGPPGGGGGGGRGPGGPGGPGGGGGFGGGGRPPGLESSTEHRFNLTLSVMARNIMNHENLNTPNGALTSLYFLQSTGITGGFGPEATASNQRRIDIQLRFSF
jgi:hypothetical protein